VSTKNDLKRRQRRWADARGIRYDARGDVRTPADNLREPLAGAVVHDLARGAELAGAGKAPARILSLTSSAALVVNVFGYWRERPTAPLVAALGLPTGAALTLEEPLPTGLVGDPPLADVALHWPDGRCVTIESKFAEWLVRRPRNKQVLKDKYFAAGARVWAAAGLPLCQALAEELQDGRERMKFLHAAQLLKHVLGLAKRGARPPTLVYLYYDCAGTETAVHRAELEHVRERLAAEVELRVLTYQDLYRSLRASAGVDTAYLDYLGERYFGA